MIRKLLIAALLFAVGPAPADKAQLRRPKFIGSSTPTKTTTLPSPECTDAMRMAVVALRSLPRQWPEPGPVVTLNAVCGCGCLSGSAYYSCKANEAREKEKADDLLRKRQDWAEAVLAVADEKCGPMLQPKDYEK